IEGIAIDSHSPAEQVDLRGVRKQIEDDIVEARLAIWDLRSSALETRSLSAALTDYAQRLVSAAGRNVEVRVTQHGSERRYPARVEEELLRVAQEAISNAIWHGRAQNIVVDVHNKSTGLQLRVSDDGQGFVANSGHPSTNSWGLTGMRER